MAAEGGYEDGERDARHDGEASQLSSDHLTRK